MIPSAVFAKKENYGNRTNQLIAVICEVNRKGKTIFTASERKKLAQLVPETDQNIRLGLWSDKIRFLRRSRKRELGKATEEHLAECADPLTRV